MVVGAPVDPFACPPRAVATLLGEFALGLESCDTAVHGGPSEGFVQALSGGMYARDLLRLLVDLRRPLIIQPVAGGDGAD
jgi:hypothetical protein